MVNIKKSTKFPGGKNRQVLTMWGDKVYTNNTYTTVCLSRPSTKYKFISVRVNELKNFEYTVKFFTKLYGKYSLLSEKTVDHYARDIANKLLELGLIGGN
ncbi:hypothetical protein [Streptococcus sp. NLN76]|uniref:hypothetical protein n=1 Tax=Streptococcus sp. NLN76 TaxID=2822800 RepID=UPI0018A96F03|nr:hypothetical protein [Streptococcus sp. NLN76]MBF8970173.1 hypothetical protein [Streptococcus sp. NLN76]